MLFFIRIMASQQNTEINEFEGTTAFVRGQDWPGHPAEDKMK